MKIRLLLTATIDVAQSMPMVERRDREVRLGDYAAALERWIALDHPVGITFCENSGADLSRLEKICEGRDVEFISYVAPTSDAARGKGYGEMGILMEAFARSERIGAASHLVKLTGRQTVKGLEAWFRLVEADPSVAVVCNLTDRLRFSDSRVFLGTPEFYCDYLFSRRDLIDDLSGFYFEHALARAAHSAMADGFKWSLPPAYPEIVGVSATKNSRGRDQTNPMIGALSRTRYALKQKAFGFSAKSL